VSDEPLTTCEKCHGKLEKQWSLSGFQFKGAGWYVTDYAGKKSDTSTEKTSTGESTAKAESASKSTEDTKTAPAKEAAPTPTKE
jgi:predicted nucleic acid-binding Zn ribbon protein